MHDSAETRRRARRRFAWRPLLRSLHRDTGYVAVGLTLIYAISGVAVNHIADWDPNFRSYATVHELRQPLGPDDRAATAMVLQRLGIRGPARSVYRAAPDQLEILLDKHSLHANPQTGRVIDEGQKPRFLLRFANWLHLNRGKKAWTYFADAYAAALIFLATSGLFMLPGRLGLRGRGGVLVVLGAAIPVLYVVLSGGP
jgi:hypothetical protein